MNDQDYVVFKALFREVSEKCFGHPVQEILSETESRLLYNEIFDKTGLVVGWKSLKNYSIFVLQSGQSKPENPSVATLDTMSRYVLQAPYITETERKAKESHYPYWFSYKEKFHRTNKFSTEKAVQSEAVPKRRLAFLAIGISLLTTGVLVSWLLLKHHPTGIFIDNFDKAGQTELENHGWIIQSPDSGFWHRRNEFPGSLTLFTLRGDNWPDPHQKTVIQNLLLREVTKNCFEAELHFKDFYPNQNWQQAGIILLEDTGFAGKALRISIAYNDFFGGYARPGEIIIQAITSFGKTYAEPEEIAHQPIAYTDSIKNNPAKKQNLSNSALKIEKQKNRFRILYAGGSVDNPAFKEVVTHEFDMQVRFIGIFAMKGFVDSAPNMPVHIKFFRLKESDCN